MTGFFEAMVASLAGLVVITIVGLSLYVAYRLTHPPRRSVNADPAEVGLLCENVTFTSRSDGIPLQGWHIPCQGSHSTVILAHGYRSNRVERNAFALQYAKDLVDSGHNVVMFDFRNSGQSQGKVSTVGHYEQRDLHGVIAWVKAHHKGPVFLHGFSMGAATCLLAAASEPGVSAVVADSSFDNLHTYLCDNMTLWSKLPSFPFNSLILALIPVFVKASPTEVAPIDVLAGLSDTPILFIHGTGDQAIPWQHSQRMYERSADAELWLVPGANHCGSYVDNPEAYVHRVAKFLRNTTQAQRWDKPNPSAYVAERGNVL